MVRLTDRNRNFRAPNDNLQGRVIGIKIDYDDEWKYCVDTVVTDYDDETVVTVVTCDDIQSLTTTGGGGGAAGGIPATIHGQGIPYTDTRLYM